jgi:hypothetical protein
MQNDKVSNENESYSAINGIICSFLSFFAYKLLIYLIFKKIKYYDDKIHNLWRLRNIILSWTHSLICSILVIIR